MWLTFAKVFFEVNQFILFFLMSFISFINSCMIFLIALKITLVDINILINKNYEIVCYNSVF